MIQLMYVGIGGFIGACSRFLLSKFMTSYSISIPLGTLFSNIIAGFLIGFIIGLERQSVDITDNTKLFLTTGLLGGLSTFSTFSLETINLLENTEYLKAGMNIVLNVILSLTFVILGLLLAKYLKKT